MKKLLQRLEEFKYYQLAKFIKARPKHINNDALNDNVNWKDWSTTMLKAHLIDEVIEYKNLLNMKIEKPTDINELLKNELADIANLAFLLWSLLEYDN